MRTISLAFYIFLFPTVYLPLFMKFSGIEFSEDTVETIPLGLLYTSFYLILALLCRAGAVRQHRKAIERMRNKEDDEVPS